MSGCGSVVRHARPLLIRNNNYIIKTFSSKNVNYKDGKIFFISYKLSDT